MFENNKFYTDKLTFDWKNLKIHSRTGFIDFINTDEEYEMLPKRKREERFYYFLEYDKKDPSKKIVPDFRFTTPLYSWMKSISGEYASRIKTVSLCLRFFVREYNNQNEEINPFNGKSIFCCSIDNRFPDEPHLPSDFTDSSKAVFIAADEYDGIFEFCHREEMRDFWEKRLGASDDVFRQYRADHEKIHPFDKMIACFFYEESLLSPKGHEFTAHLLLRACAYGHPLALLTTQEEDKPTFESSIVHTASARFRFSATEEPVAESPTTAVNSMSDLDASAPQR